MGSTLQEQFLKMGLVDKKKVENAKKAKHQQKTDRGVKNGADESKTQALQALAEKRERTKLLNQEKNREVQEQESAARIRQLIETNRLTIEEGETPYNFTDNNKIKRLYLQKSVAEQLSNGTLAIVRQAGEYQVIPARVADKVREFNRKLVVVYHSPASAVTEDPYAEYKVPDDLIW